MMHWKDAVRNAKLIHVNDDLGLTIVWNGSATFNVYADRSSEHEIDPTDCFTRYTCPEGFGPWDVGYAERIDWARRAIQNWIDDNFRPDYGREES